MTSGRAGQGGYAQLENDETIVSRLARQDTVPWYTKCNLRLLYFLMFPTCFGVEMTNGFDASMVNGLQAVSSWLDYYHHPRSALLGLMVAMYPLGCFAAAPLVPFVVDKIGRKYPILLGGVISITGAILQGSAFHIVMFIVARFILGFAQVFSAVAAASLVAELSHPKERAIMTCLFNESYYIGAVAAAWVTLGTFAMTSNWGWRIPSLLQAFPSFLQVSFIWFLPESPRWLLSQGRDEEAYTILVKYHAEGDENSELVEAEYAQIRQTLEIELNVAQMNRKEVFSTPGMRKRVTITIFLGLFTQWSGIGLISHLLPPILDSIGIHDNQTKNIINLVKYSWGLIIGTAAAFIVPRYSRRRAFLMCTTSLFIVFVAWTIASAEYSFTHSKVSAQVVLILIFLFVPAYNLAFGPLNYTFLVELFPFHARAKGISIFLWWSRGGAFFNQFVNPIGIDAIGWRWYYLYCVWNAFQVVFVYFMFPETAGRTLEELTFLYGDEQEMLRHGRAGMLREPEDTVTYGAVEDVHDESW